MRYTIACAVIWALTQFIYGEDLREFEYQEIPATSIVVDDQSVSLLVVESVVSGLQFNSRAGIRKVVEPQAAIYHVFLPPGVHIVELFTEGYLPIKLPRLNLQPKSARKFRIQRKALPQRTSERNPKLVLTWSGLPRGDIYIQTDSDPVQKVSSARGELTLRPLAGVHTVRVVSGGRQWERRLELVEGQQYVQQVVMEAEASEPVAMGNPGGIYVESDPAGASVYLNAVEQEGTTPLNLTGLVPGSYTLELRHRQHRTKRVEVEVDELEIIKLNEDLEPLYAQVTIRSEPSGALVYINDEQLGVTPYSDRLDQGLHRLRLIQNLYWEVADTLQVEAGDDQEKLYALRPRFGSVIVESEPSGASVLVDGEVWGKTPLQLDEVRSGAYSVQVSMDPYGSEVRNLDVEDGQQVRLSVDLTAKVGILRLVSEPPGASVTMVEQGRPLGDTPLRDVPVAPGIYTLRIERQGYDTVDRIVPIEAGVSVSDSVRLVQHVGHLQIETEPAGATVYVDGQMVEGTTPLIVRQVQAGKREVTVSLAGYVDHIEQVKVVRDLMVTVNRKVYKTQGPIKFKNPLPHEGGRPWDEFEFVWVEPGTFITQSPLSDDVRNKDGELYYHVTISRGFYLSITELYLDQYETKGNKIFTQPVTGRTWYEVQNIIQELNAAEGDSLYRLPSEAEWEYAARAGTLTSWSFGSDAGQLADYAWCNSTSLPFVQHVGQKKANPWGLYDMYGNAEEWVQDAYSASQRVVRGGNYRDLPRNCSSTSRKGQNPVWSNNLRGFRLVRIK